MNQLPMIITGATHQVYDTLLAVTGRREARDADPEAHPDRDSGAVWLEQVLWFVAAGVSVAVIAAILWNQIRDQAETEIDVPVAPAQNP
jgi:type VI protein secretion system component VasF